MSILQNLSKSIDDIGALYQQAIAQNETYCVSLAQHLFSSYQFLWNTLTVSSSIGKSEQENASTVQKLIEVLEQSAELLLQVMSQDGKVVYAGDKQLEFLFQRETPEQIAQLRHCIESIRKEMFAVDWIGHFPFLESTRSAVTEFGAKQNAFPEIHATYMKNDTSGYGVMRPEEVINQQYTFNLIGNEQLCGRAQKTLQKVLFQLKTAAENTPLRVVVCCGQLAVGKTNFATHLSRAMAKEINANQTLVVRCRANAQYPRTTLEIMQQIIKTRLVGGQMPTKPEELLNMYHKSFANKRTVMLIDDPVDAKQVLELLPRIKFSLAVHDMLAKGNLSPRSEENNKAAKAVIIIASRNSLALEQFTKHATDQIVDGAISEKKAKQTGFDEEYDSEDFTEDYVEEIGDDEEGLDDEEAELAPADDAELLDSKQYSNQLAKQRELELKREMAEIFGEAATNRRAITVTLEDDGGVPGESGIVKHPKNFYTVIVHVDKLDMDGGTDLLYAVNPMLSAEEGRPLSQVCDNIPIFLKCAARTLLRFLGSEEDKWNVDRLINHISQFIDAANDQGSSALKALCQGYFIGCWQKMPQDLQNLLVGLTVFPGAFDAISLSAILGQPLSRILQNLTDLCMMGLLSVETYPQFYCMHDLARESFGQHVQNDARLAKTLEPLREKYLLHYEQRIMHYDQEHEFSGVRFMAGLELYDVDLDNIKTVMDLLQEREVDHIRAITNMRHLLRDRVFPLKRGVLHQRLAKHVDQLDDRQRAAFLESFSYVYQQLTDYTAAFEKCKQALEHAKNAALLSDKEELELDQLPLLQQLGDLASTTRAFDHAKQYYEKIITVATKYAKEWQKIPLKDGHVVEGGVAHKAFGDVFSDDLSVLAGFDSSDNFIVVDPFVAHALTHLAVIHLVKNDFKQGRQCFDRGLTIMKRIYGPVHPAVSEAISAYANVLKGFKGMKVLFDEINKLYNESLEIDRALFGQDNTVQAQRLEDFGVSLLAQGKYAEAEKIFSKTIELRKLQYGDKDITVSANLNNLAVAVKNLGRLQEAEKLYEQCLEIVTAVLGPDHQQTSVTRSNLAALRSAMGQKESAEQLYQDALKGINAAAETDGSGAQTEDVKAAMLNQMGDTLRQQERFEEAIKLYEQALEIRRRISKDPDNDPEIAKTITSVAKLYFEKGDFREAENLLTEAKSIIGNQVGKEHPSYVSCISSLANALFRQQKFKQAELLFREALEIQQKIGDTDYNTLGTRQSLAVCLDMQKNFGASEQVYRELLKKMESVKVEEDKLRVVLVSLANNMTHQQRFQEAEQFFSRAEPIIVKQFGENSMQYADHQSNLGAIHLRQERYEEAEHCFSRGLVILEELLGPDHEKTAALQENLNELRTLIYERDRANKCCACVIS